VKPLLLACGLPLRRDRPSSFQRQLELLASAWRASGREVELAGPGAEGLQRAGAAVLLGYPDQFPALGDPPWGIPLFLWAQCSRPPDPRGFEAVTAVPLTSATAGFLHQAGVGRVGPIIPHAVDTGFFRPPAPGERARARRSLGLGLRFAVGAVGAHTYRKRFDLLLQAFALLTAGLPEAVLVLHTDRAVSAEGTNLLRLADSLGLGEGLLLSTEELPAAALRRLYWGLDVLASLSEWEGFGLPAAEAMACGKPCVTDVPNNWAWEVYQEGLDYHPWATYEDLCAQVDRLLAAPPDGAELRRRAEAHSYANRIERIMSAVERLACSGC